MCASQNSEDFRLKDSSIRYIEKDKKQIHAVVLHLHGEYYKSAKWEWKFHF